MLLRLGSIGRLTRGGSSTMVIFLIQPSEESGSWRSGPIEPRHRQNLKFFSKENEAPVINLPSLVRGRSASDTRHAILIASNFAATKVSSECSTRLQVSEIFPQGSSARRMAYKFRPPQHNILRANLENLQIQHSLGRQHCNNRQSRRDRMTTSALAIICTIHKNRRTCPT